MAFYQVACAIWLVCVLLTVLLSAMPSSRHPGIASLHDAGQDSLDAYDVGRSDTRTAGGDHSARVH